MEDLLESVSSSQLLILIGFLLVLAMLFIAVIVFSFVRRGRKSETGLATLSEFTTKSETNSGGIKSRTNILSTVKTSRSNDPSLISHLDLQNLTKDENYIPEETVPIPNSNERIDLASRLAVSINQPASSTSSLADEPYELLRFLHDLDTGQFIVEVGDQRYTKLTEVPDKRVGLYLLELAAHFLHFTNGVIITETGMKNLGLPKIGATPKPIALAVKRRSQSVMLASANQFNSTASGNAETALLESLQTDLQTRSQRPRSSLFNLGAAIQPEVTVPSLNLADQINEIVQERLRYVPLSRKPDVIISSSLSGGIRIKVDNDYYNTPDEVPDLEIRQLIKDSIKEWERR